MLGSIKNCLEINLSREKNSSQIFRSMRSFLELQRLVDDFVDFLG